MTQKKQRGGLLPAFGMILGLLSIVLLWIGATNRLESKTNEDRAKQEAMRQAFETTRTEFIAEIQNLHRGDLVVIKHENLLHPDRSYEDVNAIFGVRDTEAGLVEMQPMMSMGTATRGPRYFIGRDGRKLYRFVRVNDPDFVETYKRWLAK